MRCYRCGALMDDNADTCPKCGFFLRSPVEIQMFEKMTNIRIYDQEKHMLWSGKGTETALIDAPERRSIEICWGTYSDFRVSVNIKNGEAYRFRNRLSRMAKSLEDAQLVKTRAIPKRNK